MADGGSLSGYQLDLDEGRHVWVGRRDTEFLIQFRNKEGDLTHLRLSEEAGDALGYLLRDQNPDPGNVIKMIFRVMTDVKGDAKPEHGWVQVKTDTAPEPTVP